MSEGSMNTRQDKDFQVRCQKSFDDYIRRLTNMVVKSVSDDPHVLAVEAAIPDSQLHVNPWKFRVEVLASIVAWTNEHGKEGVIPHTFHPTLSRCIEHHALAQA